MPELHELERFSATLRQLPLPPTLENPQRLERFKMALLSGVESLYRDRKKPFLGELQRRLKSSELWSNNELRAGAAVCALDASRYFLVPPFAGEPPCVLLRKPPPGFDEWYGNMPTGCMMASLEEEETRSKRISCLKRVFSKRSK
ncbi:unnamed protein product [Durusdinium trenchii]|uniref:Uncharacterized protein n=1 Tax=Durusdinium trenchii TaxID=1381693 RepID=A0ABP0LMZ1_9DINO